MLWSFSYTRFEFFQARDEAHGQFFEEGTHPEQGADRDVVFRTDDTFQGLRIYRWS